MLNGRWHLGMENGTLPELPSLPIEEWPRRMRLAVDKLARDPEFCARMLDEMRQEALLDAIGQGDIK